MDLGICPKCGSENNFSNQAPFARIKCESCGTILIVPKIFKNFQLTEIVEEHKFFKKCRGFDLNTDQKVHVTILNKKFQGFRECLDICRKEVSYLKNKLNFENAIPIFESGEFDGTFYVITPDVECFKLSEYDPEVLGEIEIGSIFNAFKMIGKILSDAHEAEVEHHNLCPENILIDREGNVKIQNFFISRVIYNYESLRKSGFSVSPYYQSPEKIEKHTEDKKGDIFSLGVLFYYILCGKFPFDGDTKEEILYSRIKSSRLRKDIKEKNIQYKEPVFASEYRPEVSFDCSEFINSMLSPLSLQRPTALKFLCALDELENQIYEIKQKQISHKKEVISTETVKESKVDKVFELKSAIDQNKFQLFYQPILQINTGKIEGFEAFIRWPDSPFGSESPEYFIPFAEQNSMINDIGIWVIENACKQLASWKIIFNKNFYITLNISPQQIKDENFSSKFIDIIHKYNVSHEQIEFEVSKTKASLIEEPTPEKFNEFAELFYVRASLKEISEKYFSFKNQLKNVHLSSVKIDDIYMKDIDHSFNENSVFRSVIAFANFLSIKTIAEKVETEEQLAKLKKIGCQYAQGYYYYKPMKPDHITEILKLNLWK